jgi:hypothetical protein
LSLVNDVSIDEIDGFLRHLMKIQEDWQVSQANEAIQLYICYNSSGDAPVKQ